MNVSVLPFADTEYPFVQAIDSHLAAAAVVENHYLHRRPPISYAFGLWTPALGGVVTFGIPASRHLQVSACPTRPDLVVELNRLWVDDAMPKNTETWFLARAIRMLRPLIIVSYADLERGHAGYVYRAANFHYAGWTDMDRLTPRLDYLPVSGLHTRDAMRSGIAATVRRGYKVKYWTCSGNRIERRGLESLCGWPKLDWHTTPPPDPK